MSRLPNPLPLLCLWVFIAAGVAEDGKPNIIVLLADDLGYGESGMQGNPQIPTPHIDSIAEHGVRFTNGYVTASVCSPSRAGLLSGRYQARFNYHVNVMPHVEGGSAEGIPATEILLGERLQQAGYRTGLIGKWHLGARSDFSPNRHGFDYFFGFAHEGRYFVRPPWDGVTTLLRRKTLPDGKTGRWIRPDGKLIYHDILGSDEPLYDLNNPMLRNGRIVEENRHLTDAFTDEALQFIDRNRERPFFLCLAYNAVHSPLQAADRYMEKLSQIEDVHRRIFAAMLSHLDDSVGAVLNKLRRCNLEENTLVFFLSDNGGPTRELTSSNRPLAGGKGTYYEGGIRIPFAAQWRGKLPEGTTFDHPVISLDIYATAAEVAGNRPGPSQTDGVNLLPYLTGRSTGQPHERLFWYFKGQGAVRIGDWKLVKTRRPRPAFELYNLADDPGERDNRAQSDPVKLEQLKTAWLNWVQQMPQQNSKNKQGPED